MVTPMWLGCELALALNSRLPMVSRTPVSLTNLAQEATQGH